MNLHQSSRSSSPRRSTDSYTVRLWFCSHARLRKNALLRWTVSRGGADCVGDGGDRASDRRCTSPRDLIVCGSERLCDALGLEPAGERG